MSSSIIQLCREKGVRISEQRAVIAEVVLESTDHPDIQEIHKRAQAKDSSISLATVYRTMKLFKEIGVVSEHNFGDGRSRYEEISAEPHDHLIDLESDKIIEFASEELEKAYREIAEKHGYKLLDHKLELYAVPITKK